MLAATFFSLLLPGIEFANTQHGDLLWASIISLGMLLGALLS